MSEVQRLCIKLQQLRPGTSSKLAVGAARSTLPRSSTPTMLHDAGGLLLGLEGHQCIPGQHVPPTVAGMCVAWLSDACVSNVQCALHNTDTPRWGSCM
jgi:hypothetical protein